MARRHVPLEPGERDRAVRVEQRTASSGASGFPVETWTTLVGTYWCSREDVGGKERFSAAQLTVPYETRWEGVYRTDMDPDVVDVTKDRRLVYQGRTFDIVAASMIGRREGVEFLTLVKAG